MGTVDAVNNAWVPTVDMTVDIARQGAVEWSTGGDTPRLTYYRYASHQQLLAPPYHSNKHAVCVLLMPICCPLTLASVGPR